MEPEEQTDELVQWISQCIKDSKGHSQEWRKNARDSYSYFAGNQWTDEEKNAMKELGKLPIVFNRIARTINAVSGLEVQNRQEVRYIPRELGDVGVNEVLTGAAKWIRDGCDAEDEESESFQDVLICGMGWTDTRLDYEVDPQGRVIIDRIDPLEMGWDHTAKKRNLDDARFVWRSKKISKREFEAMWPDESPTVNSEDDLENDSDSPHDANQAKFYNENQERKDDKSITVIQFQWWERETYYQVQGETGNLVQFDAEKWKKVSTYVEGKGLKYLKRAKRVYKQAFLNGGNLLEIGRGLCNDSFSFKCITGLRDRNKNIWFGLVELMKDPQKYANKWLSQIVYILSVNSKGGLLAEQDAFVNTKKAEEQWASPDSITWLKQGGLQKIQQKEMVSYPTGLDRILQYAVEAITDVPGANLELIGLANREQAGYLEAQRKQAGITMLAIFFDSLRRYRKEQGRLMAYVIKEYISDGRLVRILGDNGQEKYIPLLHDPETCIYDVVVDDAPTSPNMKEKVFGILSQLIPQLMQAGIPIPPEVLDYTPLPENLIQKWKQILPDPNAPPPPDPKVEAQKAKLELDQQKAQQDAQLKQQQAQVDNQLKQQALNSEIQMEFTKLRAELSMEREKMMGQMQIAMQKAFSEMQLRGQQNVQ